MQKIQDESRRPLIKKEISVWDFLFNCETIARRTVVFLLLPRGEDTDASKFTCFADVDEGVYFFAKKCYVLFV